MISEASPRLLLADAEGTAEQWEEWDEPPQISAASVSAATREPPAAVNLWGLAWRVELEHPEQAGTLLFSVDVAAQRGIR